MEGSIQAPEVVFERWLKNQRLDLDSLSDEIKAPVRDAYDRAQLRAEALRATTL